MFVNNSVSNNVHMSKPQRVSVPPCFAALPRSGALQREPVFTEEKRSFVQVPVAPPHPLAVARTHLLTHAWSHSGGRCGPCAVRAGPPST